MGEIQKATGRTAEPAAPPPGTAVAVPTAADIAKQRYEHTIEAKMAYVRLLATSGLLPRVYQKQPANVLFALEYGETLGISTMAAIMGIHVIEGRPCASSGLISGLVRKAGHKLRVSGTDTTATCTIIRSDDPEYRFTFTWTMERAKVAGLTGKQVWKNYPAAMLMARSITEAARAACQDVLYGLGYTPEELGADALDDDFVPGEIITTVQPADDGDTPASAELMRHVVSQFTRLGLDPVTEAPRDAAGILVDRPLDAGTPMTRDEAEFIITELEGCEDAAALEALLEEKKAIS